MVKLLFIFILIFFNCKPSVNQSNIETGLLALRLAGIISSDVNITGQLRATGVLKNAKVEIVSIPSSGSCSNDDGSAKGTILAKGFSDNQGKYNLTYKRTNLPVCVLVTPEGSSRVETFTKTGGRRESPWAGGSMMAILPNQNSNSAFAQRRTVNVSPFTRISSRRFFALNGTTGSNQRSIKKFYSGLKFSNNDSSNLKNNTKSTPEVVFTKNTTSNLLDKANQDVENSFFPKSPADFDLLTADPNSSKYLLRLGAINNLADKLGGPADGNISGNDLEKVINFMEEDFSDGKFDGKKIDPITNTVVAMNSADFGGVVTNAADADDFLNDEFRSAVSEFDQDNPSISAESGDLIFCEEDSNDPSCLFQISIVPGSPPQILVFNGDGVLINLNQQVLNCRADSGGSDLDSCKTAYVIINVGGTNLTIPSTINITGSGYTVIRQPGITTLTPGNSTFFELEFIPPSTGAFNKPVSITSNDTQKSPYTFTLLSSGEDLHFSRVLYWDFSLADGDTATAISDRGSTNDSDTANDISFIDDYDDVPDEAGFFDRAFGSKAIVDPMNFIGNPTGNYTISAMISPISLPTNNSMIYGIMGKVGQFGISIVHVSGQNFIRYTVTTNGGTATLNHPIINNDYIGNWNQITGVYNSSQILLYVNAQLVGQTNLTGTTVLNNEFRVGFDNVSTTNGFDGGIDRVRIYSSAFNQNQVEALYFP